MSDDPKPVDRDLDPEAARRAFRDVDPQPVDPRAKEAALMRLRDAPEDELAVFGDTLREEARNAGASEGDVRAAESGHPERE